MIARLGSASASLARKFLPDPFVFAILLTFVTYVMGLVFTRSGPVEMINHWAGGFWDLLTFGMQMTLILVTGHALASTRPVRRVVVAAAALPRGTAQAASLTAFLALAAGMLNWGLGLIFGALLAREIGRSARSRGISINYPLVVAAGYSGLLIWHGGLSGSAPFVVATEGHFLQQSIGIIPVTRTIGGGLNLFVSLLLLVSVPAVYALLARGGGSSGPSAADAGAPDGRGGGSNGEARQPGESGGKRPGGQGGKPRGKTGTRGVPAVGVDKTAGRSSSLSWGRRADESRLLVLALVAMACVFLFFHFRERGVVRGLDLNVINFCFLFLGLLLHGSAVAYVKAIGDAVRGASGIVLQFPFYAGIMGMMKSSGLVQVISDWFIQLSEAASRIGVSPEASLPVTAFISAGIVNFFVPSGGGQWAVQGPIAVEAAAALGVPVEKIVMAVAYGDEWTNMLQPFWALALLGITGLKAKDIIGYTAVVMLLVFPLFMLGLLLF